MLLWWALVISSILPTRSVVETPCVRLHSLGRQQQALQPHTDAPPARAEPSKTRFAHLYRPDFFTSS